MDQVFSIMRTETTVAFVGGTSAFAIAFCLPKRQQAARPTCWPLALRSLLDSHNCRTMVMALKKQNNNDEDTGVVVYDCVVCLCEVSPRDKYKVLPNCDHGAQFHAHCITVWLKDHSKCPVCRSHIPRPLSQRLRNYLCERLLEDIIAYCNSALDNIASSIGDCHDFGMYVHGKKDEQSKNEDFRMRFDDVYMFIEI